jgi:hypothetical protein
MNRKVQIYVTTTRNQDNVNAVVGEFYNRVTDDGGVFEAEQCLRDVLEGSTEIIENTERLELFNDEQINVTSTVQNIQDISKNFTDFSQSFTIPASDHNNRILQHFYQSDVNATIDYNLRLDAFIEIDLSFFRRGKLQIEKANLKDGRPDSYTVTFYGLGVSLKDHFGEDLLNDLDYTDYNHEYSGAEVQARVEEHTNAYDVKYPLITSSRIWGYQSQTVDATTPDWLTLGGGGNNIHSTGGAVIFTELFPALRVSKILELMEAKYGIHFNGNFLSDDRFTKAFLWYKNSNWINRAGKSYEIDITSVDSPIGTVDLTSAIITTNNSITTNYIPNYQGIHVISLNVLTASAASIYYIDVYQNGNLINSIQGVSTGIFQLALFPNTTGLSDVYTFAIRPTTSITLTHKLIYGFTSSAGASAVTTVNASSVMDVYLNLASNAPKMKIVDFFAGILKTFNLACVGSGESDYLLASLDDWYGQGRIIDITKHTDVSSIDVGRMPLYKKIAYKFQESECFLNKQFSQTYNRGYGDMSYQYDYEDGEFVTELPFENLLQQTFTGTALQVGYCLNNEFAPYIPKPVLLYQYDNQDVDFRFNNGSTTNNITNYTPFGQDLRYNNEDLTLNFAPETSSLLLTSIQNTLFYVYSFSYLYALYNKHQRLVNVKTKMPTSILTSLKLNDRLVIRDKRYIINDMKCNLTNGEVDLSLYLDFRPIVNRRIFTVGASGGTVRVSFSMPNGGDSIYLTRSTESFTLDTYTSTRSTIITATIPASTIGDLYVITAAYRYTDGSAAYEDINILVQ